MLNASTIGNGKKKLLPNLFLLVMIDQDSYHLYLFDLFFLKKKKELWRNKFVSAIFGLLILFFWTIKERLGWVSNGQ